MPICSGLAQNSGNFETSEFEKTGFNLFPWIYSTFKLYRLRKRRLPYCDRRVRRGGGALGARASPAWEKSSAQKCPKEERKFRPDMSAKKNVHVPLRYDKIKTKMVGKKEENSKRKGLKLKK